MSLVAILADIGGTKISARASDWLATTFDVGGIVGTIIVGSFSDLLKVRSALIVVSLMLATPLVSVTIATGQRIILQCTHLFIKNFQCCVKLCLLSIQSYSQYEFFNQKKKI